MPLEGSVRFAWHLHFVRNLGLETDGRELPKESAERRKRRDRSSGYADGSRQARLRTLIRSNAHSATPLSPQFKRNLSHICGPFQFDPILPAENVQRYVRNATFRRSIHQEVCAMRPAGIELTGIERHFDEDELIVSKTNLKGIITYANDVFCRVSGYAEAELIGQPHNIVRHPDM